MRLVLVIAGLLVGLSSPVLAEVSPSALCRTAISGAERSFGVPDRLMQAIGVVESGRPDERGGVTAWPWTINVEGTGYVFDSKEEAIAAVNAHRARGARSIDVGCMQVNILHHGDAFGSLEQAFDPASNARYAAGFLQRLLAQTGSWPRAAAGYHSLTPDIGAEYGRKVLAVWARPGLGEPVPFTVVGRGSTALASMMPPASAFTSPAPTPRPSAPIAPAPSGLGVGGSMTARILPSGGAIPSAPAGAGGSMTGRGLDAYRAMPTRLATMSAIRRG